MRITRRGKLVLSVGRAILFLALWAGLYYGLTHLLGVAHVDGG